MIRFLGLCVLIRLLVECWCVSFVLVTGITVQNLDREL